MKADQELRSLKRGLKVLTLLNETDTISIVELGRVLDLPRTTAERILLTLVSEGYVQRIPDAKRYRLSAKVCSLSGGFSDDCWIVHCASPMLYRVTERIGWPLALATPSGDRMTLRCTTDAATSLWLNRRRVGSEAAMLNSSSGLTAFAFSSPTERDVLTHKLMMSSDRYNRERVSDPAMLESLLEPVRGQGFAFQPPPNNNPEQSIAFPIFVAGNYVASLLMVFMSRTLSSSAVVEHYAPHLRDLARQIGHAAEAREEIDPDLAIFPSEWRPQMALGRAYAH